MILNEKLVREAAEVWREASGVEAGVREAIAYYLANRTLPDRMREAADTLRETNRRMGTKLYANPERAESEHKWNAVKLEHWADRFEAEDAARAEQDQLALEVAHELIVSFRESSAVEDHAARLLAKFTITRREVS